MGFRGKQITTLTLVAATVALATSIVNLSALARLTIAETRSRAELLAETLYHQASRVIRQHGRDGIDEALSTDPSLASYAEGVVGYSPTIMYVVITGAKGLALVHSNPTARGEPVPPAPPNAHRFFGIYFLMTGLHGIHVVAGMLVIGWLMIGAALGRYDGAYYTPVDLGGLFWHLVDLIWIFLFPLFYLI